MGGQQHRRLFGGGFAPLANIVDPNTTMKASCFMASATRINEQNSLQMHVFHPKRVQTSDRKIFHLGGPMTAGERELAMGFTKNHVKKPQNDLFSVSLQNGHKSSFSKNWRKQLDTKCHHFAGNHHNLPGTDPHKFAHETGREICMKMAPPPMG